MPDINEIERRIVELEKEVGTIPVPNSPSREEFVRVLFSDDEQDENFDEVAAAAELKWKRNNKELAWLQHLERYKKIKDLQPGLWHRMISWD